MNLNLSRLLVAAAAFCSCLMSAASLAAPNQFATEAAAQKHCPKDTVTWLNLNTHTWYYKGQAPYAKMGPGIYACMMEAAGAGAHANDLVPTPYTIAKYTAPADAPSHIVVAGKEEPGERLIVIGEVTDGKAAVAGVSIYIFHTDATGHYTPGGMDDQNARLHGAMRTDANGGFSYETIRPVRYGNNPAHIHYVVNASGYRSRMVELWFADDPAIAARKAAGEPIIPIVYPPGVVQILPVIRDAQGVWRCSQTIELKRD